eukprot:TRINITY_DN3696_c0_g1_i5.p1 TRINITY_DN3696_c0_g1~~TRINITY_DN3696_c0_g1_i5.p1  ORF type:complete len:459 (-),score=90.07 TRINITY_DN3696_c0_g1_i5:348-1724(-)
MDPLLRASITAVQVVTWYQWTWVGLSSMVLFIVTRLWERLHRQGLSQRAEGVLERLNDFILSKCSRLRAVHIWYGRACESNRGSAWRVIVYLLFHIPVFALASIPAFCFVLSTNVSDRGSWFALLGNPVVVVVFKVGWAYWLTPSIASMLARFKHGVTDPLVAGPRLMVRVHKTQVTSSVLFELVVMVLAPVVSVLVLDEACFRYYLAFSPDLASLMSAWGIGQRGWTAYRQGFCSRRLLSEFSYVWLMYALMQALIISTSTLISAHPRTRRLLAWIKSRVSLEYAERIETLQLACSTQKSLAMVLNTLVVMVSFGPLVPLLLVGAPVVVWLQCCALDLEDRHPDLEHVRRFGVVTAARWLVQVPVRRVAILSLVNLWMVAGLIFVDLGFDLGPVLVYVLLSVATLAFWSQSRRSWNRSRARSGDLPARETTVIDFSNRQAEESGEHLQVPEVVTFLY